MKRIVWLLLLIPFIARAQVTTTTFSVTYTCTGSVGPFAFNFPISTAAAMTVTQNSVVLASTAYIIKPVNNNYDNGGSVTLNVACPASQPLVLKRVTPITQTSVFIENMPAPMTTTGNAVDKLTEIAQEITGGGGSIPYPSAGIANSTGSAWGTSYNGSTLIPASFLPLATSGAFGAVRPDNTTCSVTGGVLTCLGSGGTGVTGTFNVAATPIVVVSAGLVQSIGAAFSANFVCTQCGTWELGYSISSASGMVSYSNPTVPTSASVSDGTNTVTLTTPFTSWTESHTYNSNTTFTLTALGNGQTVNPTQSFTLANCTFAGLSTGGTASGATASGSGSGNQCASETATLAGVTGTLTSNGLGNTFAGQSFTFPTPGGSNISLLLTGGCGHTLTIGGFTTVFNTFALTYTNILGGSQTGMCVYTSPNPASIATTVVVSAL